MDSRRPGIAEFIYIGLTKDGWKFLTPQFVQVFLDDPALLDTDDDLFVERFHFYFDWFHNGC